MKIEKDITTNQLARMVSKGFEDSKKDTRDLRLEMNQRFDKVEKIILADYKRRIEQLEVDMRVLKSALAI